MLRAPSPEIVSGVIRRHVNESGVPTVIRRCGGIGIMSASLPRENACVDCVVGWDSPSGR